jgi:predicted proteasome-type protease
MVIIGCITTIVILKFLGNIHTNQHICGLLKNRTKNDNDSKHSTEVVFKKATRIDQIECDLYGQYQLYLI